MKSIIHHSKLKDSLRIPSFAKLQPCRQCRRHSDRAPGIEMRIAPSQPTKDLYAQIKILLHPSKPKYPKETTFL
jgi:hypothetical protein